MSSPISAIGLPGITGIVGTPGVERTTSAPATDGPDFASVLADSLEQLQSSQATADELATQAATGDLKDVHDYMIASNQAALATQMVVTIKNQAVHAFNEIMRMPV
ncbi:flagellar hook-basal body complex protein FliE [Blastococcus sp. SYSU D00669]